MWPKCLRSLVIIFGFFYVLLYKVLGHLSKIKSTTNLLSVVLSVRKNVPLAIRSMRTLSRGHKLTRNN